VSNLLHNPTVFLSLSSTSYRFPQLLPSLPSPSLTLKMTSITTFAYGLTVRATDLVTAASAWPQLEPVFHFFDLVYLRRKRGSLAGSSAANLVPVESWERVKQHFVEMEMEDAADSIIRSTLKRKECRDPQCALLDEERYTWSCLESIKFPCSDEEEGCSERRWNFFDDLCDGRHKFHAVTCSRVLLWSV